MVSILIFTFQAPTWAINPKELEGGKINVSYTDRGNGQLKEFQAIAIVKASPHEVWRIVTDYGNYQRFMPRVTKSAIEKRNGNDVEAYALLSLPWPFQNTWYINRYNEDPTHLVVKWSMLKGSIGDNSGSWVLRPYGGYTLVTYSLKVDPGVPMIPNWMIDMATQSTVPSIIQAVREQTGK